MLVLSRKKNERIIMTASNGETIKLMIVDIRGDKVRLGVEAPPDVSVHREEVQREIESNRDRLAARGIETDSNGRPVGASPLAQSE